MQNTILNVPLLTITNIRGASQEVGYKQGMRLYQFMSHNRFEDEDEARYAFDAAKAAAAAQLVASITQKGITASKADTSVYLKGTEFRKRAKVTYELGACDESDTEMVLQWKNKKLLSSAKAVDKADAWLSQFAAQRKAA